MSKVNILLSASTCYITEEFDYYGNPITHVVTTEEAYFIPFRAHKVIDVTLRTKGSDLKGSLRSARVLLRKTKLPPILVDSQERFILIPIYSSRHSQNTYFNPFNIIDIKQVQPRKSIIIFLNGKTLTVPYSERAVYIKIYESMKILQRIIYYQKNPLYIEDYPKLI